MPYFENLKKLLEKEKQEDKKQFEEVNQRSSVSEKRSFGLLWYPIAIRNIETTVGDYLSLELERTTHTDIQHQLRFGVSAKLFSNHDPQNDTLEGIITHQGGNRLKLNLRVDELPAWTRDGKLGVEIQFDNNSYDEMFGALKSATEQQEKSRLIQVLTGTEKPTFNAALKEVEVEKLNNWQQEAINKVLKSNELAIIHGPPGTGKTSTIVETVKYLVGNLHEKILLVAPSNAAVDLLTEKVAEAGISVLRVGNSSRVSEMLQSQTLDYKIAEHSHAKEIKKWKKQASEYKNMAHKYKRNFGKAEREQRNALFDEAKKLMKEAERTETYIIEDILNKTQVITATLVGANHYTVKNLKYDRLIIDEAGQSLEPACWIPILKANKVVMAGDHFQLPPTIKNEEEAIGLCLTLLEKLVLIYPEATVKLNTQYRMHEKIMAYSSQVFYKNELEAHESVKSRIITPEIDPILFIDTAGKSYDEKLDGTSTINEDEAAFLIQRVEEFIIKTGGKLQEIGIISPYKQQIAQLEKYAVASQTIKDTKSKITINTIDSFQGQERDAIFISLVRSNSEGKIGFLSDTRRMNVAMTRAKSCLVVVGDSATIGNHKFYSEFINYCENIGAYISAWEYS